MHPPRPTDRTVPTWRRPRRIAVLALDGCLRSSIAVLEDIATLTGNLVAGDGPARDKPFTIDRIALAADTVAAFDGGQITDCVPIDRLDIQAGFDLVFLPSLPWDQALAISAQQTSVISQFLRSQHALGAAIAAQGGAVAPLAASHLLDGGTAAVFWSRIVSFRNRFPEVRAEPIETITFYQDIGCASTMAAGPPMICRILDRFVPAVVATALRQQVFGGEEPYPGETNSPWETSELLVARARLWLAENFHRPVHLIDLAELLDVSERTLSRHFNAAIGMTPHDYIRNVRFDAAARMLSNTTTPVSQIANAVGYGDTRYFGRAFRDWFGMTPSVYRHRRQAEARPEEL